MRFATTFSDVRVVAVRELSHDVREFVIAPQGVVAPWTPGAHIDVSLPLEAGAQTRSYSLVGLAGPHYRIAVKRAENGRGGSRYMHGLAPGDRLMASDPANHFEIDLRRPHFLLVAGGIGATPILGMAQALARRGADVRAVLAARTRADLLFADEFAAALGERVRHVVSTENMRLAPADEIAELPAGGELYICGPLSLVEAFRRAWTAANRPQELFRTETFGSGGARKAEPFRVRIPALDLTVEAPADMSMLDALAAAGVEVMSDCRRGECGLCAVEVIAASGAIDHRDVFLSEAERRENRRICACVSRVVGGDITIDTGWRADH